MAFIPGVVVSPLLSTVLNKIADELRDEYKLRKKVKKDIRLLETTMNMTKAKIDDAEQQEVPEEAVRSWLKSLKDILYSADDVLDEHATAVALRKSRRERKVWRMISPLLFCGNSIFTTGGIAKSLKEIKEHFDAIAINRNALSIQPPSLGGARPSGKRETTSTLADGSFVVGRDGDKEKLLSWLLEPENNVGSGGADRKLCVLPIVGMGGVGKTALAKLVFNDEKVKKEFEPKMWVCVSDGFDLKRITKEMVEFAFLSEGRMETCQLTSLNAIQKVLRDKIEQKRLLLVLDDVWNCDNAVDNSVNCLLEPLKYCGKGSKIVITSRITSIGRWIDGSMEPMLLKGLANEDICRIFDRSVFGDNGSTNYPQLEEIRDTIVDKRLKGSPLAAMTLGRLLGSRLNLEYWRYIMKSEIWQLENQNDQDIFPVLYLSYQHLPSHLKQCFSYCSLFPKDYLFRKHELVMLWMAQCFIRTERDARYYFDELLNRSLFQLDKNSGSFLMHDLIHDLARLASKDDSFRMSDELRPADMIRHVSFVGENVKPENLKYLCRCRNLRTLLFHRTLKNTINVGEVLDDWFKSLRYLRVLGLHGCPIKKLPSSIENLKLLRYFDLSNTPVERLPDSLCSLYNLLVLNLHDCHKLHELPKGTTELVNLMYLKVHPRLINSLDKIGQLTSLQELKVFQVCNRRGHKIEELKDLNMLHGVLRIENLENAGSKEDANQANLIGKEHLEELSFEWSYNREVSLQGSNNEDVLEGLRPNNCLKQLMIKCHPGTSFPSWMKDNCSLPYLEVVRIRNCRKWENLPPLCQFKYLKVLEISGIGLTEVDQLFQRNSTTVAFPALEELEIKDMDKWVKWEREEQEQFLLPCLRKLRIENCLALREIPPLPQTLMHIYIRNVGLDALPGLWRTSEEANQAISNPPSSSSSSSSASSLSSLHIEKCPCLRSLNDGLLRSNLSALEKLKISDCEELKQLPEEGFSKLISLSKLEIISCPNLTFPSLQQGCLPSSLVELSVLCCSNITSLGEELLSHLTSLKVLAIGRCENLMSLELRGLSSLRSLRINDCPKIPSLTTEALSQLTSLEELLILDCEGLACLGFEALPSLELLSFRNCPSLVLDPSPAFSAPLKYLTIQNSTPELLKAFLLQVARSCLLRLIIFDCPQLTCFDEAMEKALLDLTSLHELFINRCKNLQSLPADLRNLSLLQLLSIKNCPQMKTLPDIGFPSSLARLRILDCPLLAERYSQERGPDWCKISHISDVMVS